jgi:hypothetical protein
VVVKFGVAVPFNVVVCEKATALHSTPCPQVMLMLEIVAPAGGASVQLNPTLPVHIYGPFPQLLVALIKLPAPI